MADTITAPAGMDRRAAAAFFSDAQRIIEADIDNRRAINNMQFSAQMKLAGDLNAALTQCFSNMLAYNKMVQDNFDKDREFELRKKEREAELEMKYAAEKREDELHAVNLRKATAETAAIELREKSRAASAEFMSGLQSTIPMILSAAKRVNSKEGGSREDYQTLDAAGDIVYQYRLEMMKRGLPLDSDTLAGLDSIEDLSKQSSRLTDANGNSHRVSSLFAEVGSIDTVSGMLLRYNMVTNSDTAPQALRELYKDRLRSVTNGPPDSNSTDKALTAMQRQLEKDPLLKQDVDAVLNGITPEERSRSANAAFAQVALTVAEKEAQAGDFGLWPSEAAAQITALRAVDFRHLSPENQTAYTTLLTKLASTSAAASQRVAAKLGENLNDPLLTSDERTKRAFRLLADSERAQVLLDYAERLDEHKAKGQVAMGPLTQYVVAKALGDPDADHKQNDPNMLQAYKARFETGDNERDAERLLQVLVATRDPEDRMDLNSVLAQYPYASSVHRLALAQQYVRSRDVVGPVRGDPASLAKAVGSRRGFGFSTTAEADRSVDSAIMLANNDFASAVAGGYNSGDWNSRVQEGWKEQGGGKAIGKKIFAVTARYLTPFDETAGSQAARVKDRMRAAEVRFALNRMGKDVRGIQQAHVVSEILRFSRAAVVGDETTRARAAEILVGLKEAADAKFGTGWDSDYAKANADVARSAQEVLTAYSLFPTRDEDRVALGSSLAGFAREHRTTAKGGAAYPGFEKALQASRPGVPGELMFSSWLQPIGAYGAPVNPVLPIVPSGDRQASTGMASTLTTTPE